VIGQEAGEHGTHGHNADRHDGHSLIVTASNVAENQQANSRDQGANGCGRLAGNGGADFTWNS